ncbi:hypothetical protein Aduo_008488 [Ancylostoma duodenale]
MLTAISQTYRCINGVYDENTARAGPSAITNDVTDAAELIAAISGSTETRNWAFGSSTPRDLAHMTAISSAQRVYDAKSPKKSTTSPEFVTPVHKRSTTAPQPIQRPAAPPTPPKKLDEDAASEPDFVQDREEFIAELRKKKGANPQKKEKEKEKAKDDKKMNGKINAVEKPKTSEVSKTAQMDEPPRFTHASELASEVHSTERVPANLHEEESGRARENVVTGMKDQIVVSELTEATPDKEIVIDKDGAEKLEKLVEAKTNEILKKVENVSADVAKDLKDFAKDMRAAAEANIDSAAKEVEKTLDSVGDEAAKTTEQMATGASDIVSRIGSTISSALNKAEDVVEKTQKELLGSPEKPHEEEKTLIG